MAQRSKRLKSAEKEDRISDLPDHLIQHIISFLPSTKQAIRTGILSRRWRKQWTHVPVLIFDSAGMSRQNFIKFIDNTLVNYQSSKINTFCLRYKRVGRYRDHFEEKIRFATIKQVKDLTLSCAGGRGDCLLPGFIFNTCSVVKFKIGSFSLEPTGKVNWVSLKALTLDWCRFSNQSMQYILSGSPLLESFELRGNHFFEELVITSESLKNLALDNLSFDDLEISCPNLEKLSVERLKPNAPELLSEAIENVLSNSLLLEALMVHDFHLLHLPVIASQSLKRLVMDNISSSNCFKLSCQKLEELKLLGFIDIKNVNFRNVPYFLCATLDFDISFSTEEILWQLRHIKELRVGRPLLASLELFKASYPVLHIKCLILESGNWCTNLTRVACFLRNCSVLETLVLTLFFDDPLIDYIPELNGFEENYWSSNAIGFSCLVSRLKTIKIYGIPKGDRKPTRMLSFIQFLLNNARVLENMTVVLPKTCHTDYTSEVSQELSAFTRRSGDAIVELISD